MIYGMIGLSLVFVAIGFIVTESNAKYLLSGYNSMSEEDRKKVDLHSYLQKFKKFHVGLGLSFLIIGSAILYGIGQHAVGIFIVGYPILAYLYFFWRTTQNS